MRRVGKHGGLVPALEHIGGGTAGGLARLPLEGSRVFIRVCQEVNGWQNEAGMFRTSALVPDNRDGANRPKPTHWRHNTLVLPHK